LNCFCSNDDIVSSADVKPVEPGRDERPSSEGRSAGISALSGRAFAGSSAGPDPAVGAVAYSAALRRPIQLARGGLVRAARRPIRLRLSAAGRLRLVARPSVQCGPRDADHPGHAPVNPTFLRHTERARRTMGVDVRSILREVGRRGLAGGGANDRGHGGATWSQRGGHRQLLLKSFSLLMRSRTGRRAGRAGRRR
jgi:hypothetical protein